MDGCCIPSLPACVFRCLLACACDCDCDCDCVCACSSALCVLCALCVLPLLYQTNGTRVLLLVSNCCCLNSNTVFGGPKRRSGGAANTEMGSSKEKRDVQGLMKTAAHAVRFTNNLLNKPRLRPAQRNAMKQKKQNVPSHYESSLEILGKAERVRGCGSCLVAVAVAVAADFILLPLSFCFLAVF